MNQTGAARVRTGKLLYTDEVGHDACGIGGVGARDGKPSAEVLRKAITALKAMEHRGGVCGDAGDGAGLTTIIPQGLFREEAKRLRLDGARDLRAEDTLAIGVLFIFETDSAKANEVRALLREVLSGGPMRLLGFRSVPTVDDILPEKARNTRPSAIEQVLLKVEGEVSAAERWLFLRRLELRKRLTDASLSAYIPSLSAKLVSYKGLLTCPQLADFYPDLQNPAFETGIAIFHRRYSTNTFPNWVLGQPFRLTCHNGEINTIRTTRNAVSAFARGLQPPLPGGDLLTSKVSDSASLDEWIEYLMREQNWSLLRALRLSVPPVWDTEA
ncbi:MAG: glutamate synthase subunit alpha, partial [Planctomycetia bacterium]|nr:glutamate synthase subunit alpha [Planctomycetia bacterium]